MSTSQAEIKRNCRRNKPTGDSYIVGLELPFELGRYYFRVEWSHVKGRFVANPIMLIDEELYIVHLGMSDELHKICRRYFKRMYCVRYVTGINQTDADTMSEKLGIRRI